MTMVERVAWAIEPFLKDLTTSTTEDIARLAIEAMREPEGMMFMKGGNVPPSNQGRDHLGPRRSSKRIGDLAAKECWETMIDEALK